MGRSIVFVCLLDMNVDGWMVDGGWDVDGDGD